MALRKETKRLIIAIVVGPLSIIPAIILYMTLEFILSPSNPPDLLGIYLGGLFVALLGLVYAYGYTLIYGVPSFLLLRKYKMDNAITILIVSLIPVSILFAINPDRWFTYGEMAYLSVVVALSCWLIATK